MINVALLDPTIIEREDPIPPIIYNIKNGIIYRDIKYDQFEEAIKFLIENYIGCNKLFKAMKIAKNSEAIEAFSNFVRFLLKEDCSMVAIEEATGRIVGLVLIKIMFTDSWSFVRLVEPPPPVGFIYEFKFDLFKKTNFENKFDPSKTLHFFDVCIARDMKGLLLKEELIRNAYKIAISVGCTLASWTATSRNDQERARRLGFVKIGQANYDEYVDMNGLRYFKNIETGEHFAELVVCNVPKKQPASIGDWLLYDNY